MVEGGRGGAEGVKGYSLGGGETVSLRLLVEGHLAKKGGGGENNRYQGVLLDSIRKKRDGCHERKDDASRF